jgi:hypothetical protein
LPLFLFLAVVVSLACSVVTFLVLAIAMAIFDAATAREPAGYEAAVLVALTLAGFMLPLIVFVGKRRTVRGQSRSVIAHQTDTTDAPETTIGQKARTLVQSEDQVLTSLAPQTPPPLDTFLLGNDEGNVSGSVATAPPVAAQKSDAGTNWRSFRPRLTIGRLIISAGIFLALLLAVALFSGGGDLGLEVRSEGGSVMITNLRNDPSMPVLDIVVNNRDECSTDGALSLCRSMPNATNSSFLTACSRLSRYDSHQLHMLWVHGGANLFSNAIPAAPISLKIGDSHLWPTGCQRVVQVQITTNKGTATYSFSE